MSNQITVGTSDFLSHLNAPFFGKTHDQDGNALPSKRTKSWVFTLGNVRKDNHLTFKSTRYKGQTVNDPVEVSLNLQGLNSIYDPVYQTIGTVDSKGTLRIKHGLDLNQPRMGIGYDTLVWLLNVATSPDFEMPNHLQIMCEARCARCRLPLTNPNSLKSAIGPVCRSKINKSKPAKRK